MNMGACKALGSAFFLFNNIIKKLVLENNGTNDKMFKAILQGLQE